MSEDLSSQKQQLEQIKSFMKTAAYRSYVATFKIDVSNIELNIVNTIPTDPESTAHLLQLHGRREELIRSVSFFESSQAALEEQIAAAEDAQTEVPDSNEEHTTND